MAKKVTTRKRKVAPVAKECYFCVEKKTPDYQDTAVLQRYLTERGKIVPGSRNGLCALHQRRLTSAIKHARHLALLPFVVRS